MPSAVTFTKSHICGALRLLFSVVHLPFTNQHHACCSPALQIFSICETERIPATFFELTTAMAFAHFAEAQADVVVVEAGLGGKLDATNIITPALSIITSVG
jgi:folylpolyglutamate synthase/dihydropteroate synthase